MKGISSRKIHILCHTHWDREWRTSAQTTQLMLAPCLDMVLDILAEAPDYRYFHLDGQTNIIDDYLELRPERREELEERLRSGQLVIGPWFTALEINALIGESVVRNLLAGQKMMDRYGQSCEVCVTNGSDGQVSQMPQICRGFNMPSMIFRRGIGAHRAEKEWIWEGADGTRILGLRVASEFGRSNFYVKVYNPVVMNPGGLKAPFQHPGSIRLEKAYRLCEEDRPFLAEEHPEARMCLENLEPAAAELLQSSARDATTSHLLYFHGYDNTEPDLVTTMLLHELQKIDPENDYVIDSVENAVRGIRQEVDWDALTVLRGEMREPQKGDNERDCDLNPGTLSARMDLKLENRDLEVALTRYVEPWATVGRLLGDEYPARAMDKAWRLMLYNHFHDSIGGASIPEVNHDVEHRSKEIREICDWTLATTLGHIARRADTSWGGEEDAFLCIFNSSPFAREDVVSATVDLPGARPDADFAIHDADGNEIPYQVSGAEQLEAKFRPTFNFPLEFDVTRFSLRMPAGEVPALGYRVLGVTPGREGRVPEGSLVPAENELENEFLHVRIEADGSLTVTDRETGRTYEQCNYFESSGDVGDQYYHVAPEHDECCDTLGERAEIELLEDGPLACRYRVTVRPELPVGANGDRTGRKDERRRCTITSELQLTKGSRRLDITTTVRNSVEDHRLRAVFPSDLEADCSHAEVPFDVIERPIELKDTTGWSEPDIGQYPQVSFAEVSDGEVGLALINHGITEYEVKDTPRREIALTLLRCTENSLDTGFSDVSREHDETQCLGEHEFRYSIFPHAGRWDECEIYREVEGANVPHRVVQFWNEEGGLPPQQAFFDLGNPALVLSCVKKRQDGDTVVLRIFNPRAEQEAACLSTALPMAWAREIQMNEKDIVSELQPSADGSLEFALGPKKVKTIEIAFAG